MHVLVRDCDCHAAGDRKTAHHPSAVLPREAAHEGGFSARYDAIKSMKKEIRKQWRPRQSWGFSPTNRIHGEGKVRNKFNRARVRKALRQMMEDEVL